MLDLFRNELKCYWLYALAIFIAQLIVWGFLSTQSPVLDHTRLQDINLSLFMLLSGFTFGVVQMKLHKRKNHWTYLVHRPLAPHKIHLTLTGAGSLLLLISVVLPFSLFILGNDLLTNQPVELRHYLYSLHMLSFTLICYFIGTYVVLSPGWGALLSLVLINSLDPRGQNPASLLLVNDLVTLLIIYYLSRRSFKVNLTTHFEKKRDIFLAALIIQPAIVGVLLMSQTIFYHLPLFLFDAHPDQYEKEQLVGTYTQIWALEKDELVEMVLENSDYPNTDKLVKQVKLAKTNDLDARPRSTPVRGQIFKQDKSYALDDDINNKIWIFSHKEMLLVGRDKDSDDIVGYLSERGFFKFGDTIEQQDRFTVIPTVVNNRFVKTHDKIYVVDFGEELIELKHQLENGEKYTSKIQFDNENRIAAVLSNKAVYFFDIDDFNQDNEYADPTHTVPHFKQIDGQQFIEYMILVDGYLLNYPSSDFYGFRNAGTALVYAKHDGSNQLIGEMAFEKYRAFPELVDSQTYWTSPIIRGTLYDAFFGFFHPEDPSGYVTLDNVSQRLYQAQVYYVAIALAILSALLTYFVSLKLPLDRSRRFLWTSMTLVFSFPGFIAFLLMNRWREYVFPK